MVIMLKNKCTMHKRNKFLSFWYHCYYVTLSETYFIQLETLLMNHPSHTKITQKWPDFNSTLKQSCQYLITDNYKESPANWNTFSPWLISNLMHKILIYLYIIHLLKSSTCFMHYPAHLQAVYIIIVYMQPLVSPLSAGDCPVHRLRTTRPVLS
jgi:hypothetical protein